MDKFKYLFYLIFISVIASCGSSRTALTHHPDTTPKREFRGAWIQTVGQSRYYQMNSSAMKHYLSEMVRKLDEAGVSVSHIEGYRSNSWILLDYVDVIVNVFSDEAREFYDLDRLWQDGKPVDLTSIID